MLMLQPVQKSLSRTIQGSGKLVPRHKSDLINESGWKVTRVHVGKNDTFQKGQVLVTYDTSQLDEQLLNEEAQLQKMNLNREALKEQFVAAQRETDEDSVRKAKRDLESQQLDIEMQQRKIEGLRKERSDKGTLKAPFDGKVTDIYVEEGLNASQGQAALSLARMNEGFEFTFTTDEDDADALQLEEKVSVRIAGENAKSLEGTIIDIKDASASGEGGPPDNRGSFGGGMTSGSDNGGGGPNAQKTIVISVIDDTLTGEEKASVRIDKPMEGQGLVIPKKLVYKDSKGNYVFVIREKKSPVGNTFHAQKAYVNTGSSTDDEIIVLSGLSPKDEIISETSEPLQEGNRVRIK